MNLPAPRSFVFALSVLFAATTLSGAPARPPRAKTADQFARTKEHIDALLKRRLNPEPLPANPPNPFQNPAGLAVLDPHDGPPPDQAASHRGEPGPDLPAPGSDSEMLSRLAATLKISGIVKLNGQVHLIINQAPYKEGDRIPLFNKTATVYLQVVRIAPNELTLSLNDAEQTVKFKN